MTKCDTKLSVVKKARLYAGSCSACSDPDHTTVFEIALAGVFVRVCERCRKALVELLRRA